MKTKHFLLLALLFTTFSSSAQKKNNLKYKTYRIDSTFKQNQLITDYLKRLDELTSVQKRILQNKINSGSFIFGNDTREDTPVFGKIKPRIARVFYDGTEVLGDGINRLQIINRLKIKDLKEIQIHKGYYSKILLFSKEEIN